MRPLQLEWEARLMPRTQQRIKLPEPYEYQEEVLGHPARFKIPLWGRRSGKTTLGSISLLTGHGPWVADNGAMRRSWKGALNGGNMAWVSPTAPMATDTWQFLKNATVPLWQGNNSAKNETFRRIYLPGGGVISVKSADDPDSLRGAGYDGVVLDEFAQMRKEVWTQVLLPTLLDRRGWAIFIGTPKGYNWAHDLYQQAQIEPDLWKTWQQPTHLNPLIAPEDIEIMAREMNPTEYAQEILAEFIMGEGTIFKREWWQYYDELPKNLRYEIYVDAASKTGVKNDYTVFATWATDGKDYYLVDLWREKKEYWEVKDGLIQWHAEARRNVRQMLPAIIEDASAGSALLQDLRHDGRVPVIAFPEKHDPIKKLHRGEQMKIVRAEHVTPLLEAKKVFLPRHAKWLSAFIEEHAAFPHVPHDDMVDTTTMALWRLSRTHRRTLTHQPYTRQTELIGRT
jgi:predicted phage terminase large subunit-like protein